MKARDDTDRPSPSLIYILFIDSSAKDLYATH